MQRLPLQRLSSPARRAAQGENERVRPHRSRTLRAVPPQPPGGGGQPCARAGVRRAVRHRHSGMAGHRDLGRPRTSAGAGRRAVDPDAQVGGEPGGGAPDRARLGGAQRQCPGPPRGAAQPDRGRTQGLRAAGPDRAGLPGAPAGGPERQASAARSSGFSTSSSGASRCPAGRERPEAHRHAEAAALPEVEVRPGAAD